MTLILSICTYKLDGKICLGCGSDNGGGGSGSGGPAYNCDTMGNVIYVDISRENNSGNGKSWATAKKYLHSALDIANRCSNITTVRVARGTYKPNISSTNKDLTFFIGNNISLIGGYPSGGGSTPDHVNNPTILDGGLVEGTEVYHIMVIYDQSSRVLVQGFRFRNGFAEGSGSIELEAGVNMSRQNGAAVYVRDCADVRFEKCALYTNVALGFGGAIFSNSSTLRLVNTIFSDNTAGNDGGALYLQSNSIANISSSTFSKNYYYAGGGGAIYNTTGTQVNIANSILWGNTNTWNGGGVRNVDHCLLQDANTFNGGTSSNIIRRDPQFVNPDDINGPDNIFFNDDDGLNVCEGSEAINRGNNNASYIPNVDITDNSRIFNLQVDIGSYEYADVPGYTGFTLGEDTIIVSVFSGITSLPDQNCKIMALMEPDNPVNDLIYAMMVQDTLEVFYNDATKFVTRRYYFQDLYGQDFNGKITLFFTENDFTYFNNLPYSQNNLPTYSSQSLKSNLRIVKFPGYHTSLLPQNYTSVPEIIDPSDSDITIGTFNHVCTVTFHNSGPLGLFLVTTTKEYIFNGNGKFSNPSNWQSNIKPNGILPSFNTIRILPGSNCELDEGLETKPMSLIWVGSLPI